MQIADRARATPWLIGGAALAAAASAAGALDAQANARDGLLNPGTKAPGFVLRSMDKKRLSLGDVTRTKVALVNFVAIRSGFCQLQLPELQKVYTRYRLQGLEVICVGVGKAESEDEVRRHWDVNKLTMPVAMNGKGPDDVFRLYKGSNIPTVYLIGKDGKVLSAWAGFSRTKGAARLKAELAKAGFAEPRKPGAE